MSVHKRQTHRPFEVRWTEPSGRQRSRSFTRERDATRFDERVARLKENGRLAELDAEGVTIAQFGGRWWQHAHRDLAANTRRSYQQQWNHHILPRLGAVPLASVTAIAVEDFRADMEADDVGAPTIRLTMAVLQAALSRAVVWGYLPSNPVDAVRKPTVRPAPRRPIPPADVEAMRAVLSHQGREHDALLVVTLAYAGLRPEEALALRWGDIGAQTIRVERAVAFGEGKATKTEHARAVRLLGPLATDLESHRARPQSLVWPKPGLWKDHDYRNWRRRVYQPVATLVGMEDKRPYTLRASFASLLIADGRTVTHVARQCGHSVETCMRHYVLAFDEFDGRRIDAEATILAARQRVDLRCIFAETPCVDTESDRDTG